MLGLTPEQKEILLGKYLESGSIDQDKFWLGQLPEGGSHIPAKNPPSWCTCGHCREMKKEEEKICCGSSLCITQWDFFQPTVLQCEMLEVAAEVQCNLGPVE